MNTLNFVDVYDFVSTIPYIHNNILDKVMTFLLLQNMMKRMKLLRH